MTLMENVGLLGCKRNLFAAPNQQQFNGVVIRGLLQDKIKSLPYLLYPLTILHPLAHRSVTFLSTI